MLKNLIVQQNIFILIYPGFAFKIHFNYQTELEVVIDLNIEKELKYACRYLQQGTLFELRKGICRRILS